MKIKERLKKGLISLKRNWWLFLLQSLCVAPICLFMIGADFILTGKIELNNNNPVMFNIGGIEFTYVHLLFTIYTCFVSILIFGLFLCLYLLTWQVIDSRNKKYGRQVESTK